MRAPFLYRPVLEEMAGLLEARPPGIYAYALSFPPDDSRAHFCAGASIAPRFTRLEPVDERRVLDASQQLVAARRFPIALPPMLPCPFGEWEQRVAGRLQRLSALVRSGRSYAAGAADPEWLRLEGECIWVGAASLRPSRAVSTAALREWVPGKGATAPSGHAPRADSDPAIGDVVAALLLGQRHAGFPHSAELRAWAALGSAFPAWAPDLLVRMARRCGGPRGALEAATLVDESTSEAAYALVSEILVIHPDLDPRAALRVLPVALAGLESACDAARHRRELLLGLVGRAFEQALAMQDQGHGLRMSFPSLAARFHHEMNAALDSALPGVDACEVSPRRPVRDRVAAACRRLLGWTPELRGLPDQPGDLREWPEFANVVLATLAEETRARLVTPPIQHWMKPFAGLAGRIAALAGRVDCVMELGEFVEAAAASRRLPPGPQGDEAIRVALHVAEYGIWAGESDPMHLARFVQMLGADGPAVIDTLVPEPPHRGHVDPHDHPPAASERLTRQLASERQCLAEVFEDPVGFTSGGSWPRERLHFWTLARLGSLEPGEVRDCHQHGLLPHLAPIMILRPGSLPRLVRWLSACDPSLRERHGDGIWWRLFLSPDEGFIHRVTAMAADAVRVHGIPGAAVTRLMDDVFLEYHDADSPVSRREFLRRREWLLSRLIRTASRHASELVPGSLPDLGTLLHGLAIVFPFIHRWQQLGFADEPRAARLLLDSAVADIANVGDRAPMLRLRWHTDTIESLVDLSVGDPERLVSLVRHPLVCRFPYDVPVAFRSALQASPALLRLFIATAGVASAESAFRHVASIWPMVPRVASPAEAATMLREWEEAAGVERPREDANARLDLLRRCRVGFADEPFAPRALRFYHDPAAAWIRERDVLLAMEREGRLPDAARPRLRNLESYLSRPDEVRAFGDARMARWAERRLPAVQVALLASMLQARLARWKERVGLAAVPLEERDWKNALRIYLLTKQNRRILLRIMRDRASGGNRYGEQHPVNRAFLRSMEARSLRMEAWLDPPPWSARIDGRDLTLVVERDPLKVFQMGNLFGTCLSAGAINSHAVVANAAEINKRVLFLMDGRRVIGRKLIVLSRRARVVGYCSYGAGLWSSPRSQHPWVKIVFDLYCQDLAREVGAELDLGDDLARYECRDAESDLVLFSKWYDDGAEAFDPWILLRTGRGPAPGPDDADAVEAWAMTGEPSLPLADARMRALIWAGSDESRARELEARGCLEDSHLEIFRLASASRPG